MEIEMTEDEVFEKAYRKIQDFVDELCGVESYNPLMVAGILMATAKMIYKTLLPPVEFTRLMDTITEDIKDEFTSGTTIH
tara:strand:- start:150 stop:389 length:240 start_codon:yes stop_codon:yes gene_type:complete